MKRKWLKIFTSSGARPCSTATRRIPAMSLATFSIEEEARNTASACCPARSLPLGDPVARKMTGVRCGDGSDRCDPEVPARVVDVVHLRRVSEDCPLPVAHGSLAGTWCASRRASALSPGADS